MGGWGGSSLRACGAGEDGGGSVGCPGENQAESTLSEAPKWEAVEPIEEAESVVRAARTVPTWR